MKDIKMKKNKKMAYQIMRVLILTLIVTQNKILSIAEDFKNALFTILKDPLTTSLGIGAITHAAYWTLISDKSPMSKVTTFGEIQDVKKINELKPTIKTFIEKKTIFNYIEYEVQNNIIFKKVFPKKTDFFLNNNMEKIGLIIKQNINEENLYKITIQNTTFLSDDEFNKLNNNLNNYGILQKKKVGEYDNFEYEIERIPFENIQKINEVLHKNFIDFDTKRVTKMCDDLNNKYTNNAIQSSLTKYIIENLFKKNKDNRYIEYKQLTELLTEQINNKIKTINEEINEEIKKEYQELLYLYCMQEVCDLNLIKNTTISAKTLHETMEKVDTLFSELTKEPIDLKKKITWSQAINPFHINAGTLLRKILLSFEVCVFFLLQDCLFDAVANPAEDNKKNIIISLITAVGMAILRKSTEHFDN